ncbi:MAG: hypothetical protein WC901_05090 [Candidatus Margulisiibacteriota bacterium]
MSKTILPFTLGHIRPAKSYAIALLTLFFALFFTFSAQAEDFIETARIQITNERGGAITVSHDKGKTWNKIGQVLAPAQKVNNQGFTASKWVQDREVAAVAVNAIHIKCGYNKKDDRGIVFSILPKEFSAVPDDYNSFYSPSSSILTDIPAGKLIFGEKDAPYVGNQVQQFDAGGAARTDNLSPVLGSKYLIIVEQPQKYPRAITFENRFGGKIVLVDHDGSQKIIGQVLRPVIGVGRFPGTKYAEVGRIRANHAAVIDVSTSRLNKIGGFQIIPAQHGMDAEMVSARTKTQWMVVGPPAVIDPALEGVAPLFKYFIQPAYTRSDLSEKNWREILLSRFLVEVKLKDKGKDQGKGKWEAMPLVEVDPDQPLPPSADKALEKITDMRILFPVR